MSEDCHVTGVCGCDKNKIELTEAEKRVIELLRYFKKDRSLQHLPAIFIKKLQIMKSRDEVYNNTNSCYENTFGEGDGEAFINCKRNFERIRDILHNGNNHLEIDIPSTKLEEKEILEDQSNYLDIWMCNRWERRQSGAN